MFFFEIVSINYLFDNKQIFGLFLSNIDWTHSHSFYALRTKISDKDFDYSNLEWPQVWPSCSFFAVDTAWVVLALSSTNDKMIVWHFQILAKILKYDFLSVWFFINHALIKAYRNNPYKINRSYKLFREKLSRETEKKLKFCVSRFRLCTQKVNFWSKYFWKLFVWLQKLFCDQTNAGANSRLI